MIKQSEIQSISSKLGVRDTQIEKDYVIGWVLKGISNNELLRQKLLFKGGTAIRKIYINDYRLSEDLDFTFIDDEINETFLKNEFDKVCQWVEEESRITLETREHKLRATGNYNFYIGYVGPLGGKISKKDIKVDISNDELICFEPSEQFVINEYSDLKEEYKIKCYSIGEIVSEKLRSLMQRTAPRDLYDLWYHLEKKQIDILDFVSDFEKKTIHKKLDPKMFGQTIREKEDKYRINWKNSLEKQINDIPDFEMVWRALNRHFKKLLQ